MKPVSVRTTRTDRMNQQFILTGITCVCVRVRIERLTGKRGLL